ncbi:MAG TPA: flagellar hook-associated protein FlgK [Anaerolineaceae bacterium]|nr:flagellar hook-associated protein FlgK [Anaerolineaceae bacterium]HPN52826.1 flagellar hook-associated protein FlgK [Anaerolineaceae bacterium]
MPGAFSGINMIMQALMAQQEAMQVVGHNVANANTPGYRRQEAILTASHPRANFTFMGSILPGQFGTGVLVDRIKRYDTEFIDQRYCFELGENKRWATEADFLNQVEMALADTGSESLAKRLNDFWGGWQSLSTSPDDLTIRQDTLERSKAVADSFNRRASALNKLRGEQDLTIRERVDEINELATQLARLNVEITHVESTNHQPNDLLDERDKILNRLSEISGAKAAFQQFGQVVVSIGGHTLVIGSRAFEVTATPDPANGNLVGVGWQDGEPFSPVAGELKGLMESRDGVVVDQLNRLNTMAISFMDRINAIHITGYDLNNVPGQALYTGTDALSMRINTTLTAENLAAASVTNAPGDGTIAKLINDVQRETLVGLNNMTLGDYNNLRIGDLGLTVKRSTSQAADHKTVMDALDQQRDSVSGVNLDEEATKMLAYQKSYQAATRMMTALDEMLDRVINNMGVVGR